MGKPDGNKHMRRRWLFAQTSSPCAYGGEIKELTVTRQPRKPDPIPREIWRCCRAPALNSELFGSVLGGIALPPPRVPPPPAVHSSSGPPPSSPAQVHALRSFSLCSQEADQGGRWPPPPQLPPPPPLRNVNMDRRLYQLLGEEGEADGRAHTEQTLVKTEEDRVCNNQTQQPTDPSVASTATDGGRGPSPRGSSPRPAPLADEISKRTAGGEREGMTLRRRMEGQQGDAASRGRADGRGDGRLWPPRRRRRRPSWACWRSSGGPTATGVETSGRLGN
nr:unnamed protein product [Digitaria exilis]